MTQEQAVEEAKKFVASISATKGQSEISIRVPDRDSAESSLWVVTFKQEKYSEMDDRGFWMDLIKWEFENITRE